jgi:uncharacterized membrane protein
MILLSLIVVAGIVTSHIKPSKRRVGIAFPAITVAGAVVGVYALYIQMSGGMAANGPFGDCDAVLHSSYTRVFCTLPISVLSLLGYLIIIGIWIVSRVAAGLKSDLTTLCLFGIVCAGTVLAVYLVSLQLFFIGVTCTWCLVSSLFITSLMWLVAPKVNAAWANVSPVLPVLVDRNVVETISQKLKSRILPSYNDIEVTVRRRHVTLRGRVNSACHSNLAEHIATTVDGVRAVDNAVEVIPSKDSMLEWCGRITRKPFTLHQTARELRPVISRTSIEPSSNRDPERGR